MEEPNVKLRSSAAQAAGLNGPSRRGAPPILIIAGPTASGKSAMALEVAEKSGGVIINADSQQMYAELRILTARPAPEEEARVPMRLYGTLPAAEACSAGKWLKFAKMEIDWALGEEKPAIVVGGTGLYLKALTEGISEIPDVPTAVRAQATADLRTMGNKAFHERLGTVDMESMVKIRPSDTQRMVRAWEVFLATGKPLSFWQGHKKIPLYGSELIKVFHVKREREEIYARCNGRFQSMINNGAVQEVENLLKLQLPDALPAMHVIGVPELREYLAGACTLEEAVEKGQQATRNYAKRQMTWLRTQMQTAQVVAGAADILRP